MQNETKGMLYGLIGVVAFGLTLPATRVVVPYMDPVFIGLGRAVLASVVAAMMLGFTRQKIPNKEQIVQLYIVVLGVVLGFPVLSSWAMQYVPAAHGGVVLGVLPLATAIVGVLISSEKPSMAFWLMSILGSALVVIYSLLQGAGGIHVADIALFGAIVSAAVGYAYGARLSKTLGGWQVICWALVLACPFILIPAISYAPKEFSGIPLSAHLCFLYLALVSQLFGFFAWYKGLALGGIARVSQLQLLQPFVTLFASALWLGEVIDLQTLIFALLVVSIVWLGRKIRIGTKPEKSVSIKPEISKD